MPFVSAIPYDSVLAEAKNKSGDLRDALRQVLPGLWCEAYREMTPRMTNILRFTHGTFEYLYDDYATLEATGVVPLDDIAEARLVVAVGISSPSDRKRDDSRLRGWLGPTGEVLGEGWDKGHFIAHSIGGAVDGLEANVFVQRRRINRGGYRTMERYCAANPGVFCFSRPIYTDPSARPTSVEFGVLTSGGELWIQMFENT